MDFSQALVSDSHCQRLLNIPWGSAAQLEPTKMIVNHKKGETSKSLFLDNNNNHSRASCTLCTRTIETNVTLRMSMNFTEPRGWTAGRCRRIPKQASFSK